MAQSQLYFSMLKDAYNYIKRLSDSDISFSITANYTLALSSLGTVLATSHCDLQNGEDKKKDSERL